MIFFGEVKAEKFIFDVYFFATIIILNELP